MLGTNAGHRRYYNIKIEIGSLSYLRYFISQWMWRWWWSFLFTSQSTGNWCCTAYWTYFKSSSQIAIESFTSDDNDLNIWTAIWTQLYEYHSRVFRIISHRGWVPDWVVVICLRNFVIGMLAGQTCLPITVSGQWRPCRRIVNVSCICQVWSLCLSIASPIWNQIYGTKFEFVTTRYICNSSHQYCYPMGYWRSWSWLQTRRVATGLNR